MAAQRKAKIKNPDNEYKRVKDHNSKSRNGRETFTYYKELKKMLYCRATNMPKTIVECGYKDGNLAIPESSLEELSEPGDDESIRDREEQTLSRALSRRKPAAKKGNKHSATTPKSSKHTGQKSAKSAQFRDEDLTFSESHFSRVYVEAMEQRLLLKFQACS